MAPRIPTRDDLQRWRRAITLTLSPEENPRPYHAVLADIFPCLSNSTPCWSRTPPRKYPQRDPGGRPEALSNDPYNAIVRPLLGRGSDPWPAGRQKRIGLKDNMCLAGVPMTYGSSCVAGAGAGYRRHHCDTSVGCRGTDCGRAQHGHCLLRRRPIPAPMGQSSSPQSPTPGWRLVGGLGGGPVL